MVSDSFVIRRAGPDDVVPIRELTLRAYAKWLSVTPRKPRPMTADYAAAIRTNRFDLLYEGGNLIGLVESDREGDELMIVNVAVDPGHQGRGLGTLLMRHTEERAAALGLHATRLYTNKLMTENIALYERLGYEFEKETHHEAGTVAVHMVRPLA